MIKLPLVAIAVFATWSAPTSAFVQAKSLEGNAFPVQYDRDGVQHYPTFGYYGPMAPPMPSEANSTRRARAASALRANARAVGRKATAR
jgi:hypothetical protein